MSIASPPSSVSSSPTWGPTNSTRRRETSSPSWSTRRIRELSSARVSPSRGRDPHQHVAHRAEVLHRRLLEARPRQRAADRIELRGLGVADLDQGFRR